MSEGFVQERHLGPLKHPQPDVEALNEDGMYGQGKSMKRMQGMSPMFTALTLTLGVLILGTLIVLALFP